MSLSEIKDKTFTIINQIPTSETTSAKIKWVKKILNFCGKQNGLQGKTNETMLNKSNSWTAYVGDWKRFKEPNWSDTGYYSINDVENSDFYTANVGDLLVFDEIPDAAPDSMQEFQRLVQKYKDIGGLITSVEVYINYKSNGAAWKTNHIELIKR